MATIEVRIRDNQGNQVCFYPGLTPEKAHELINWALTMPRLNSAGATPTRRRARPAPEPATAPAGPPPPAFVKLENRDDGGACGWWRQTSTGKERWCGVQPGHDKTVGPTGGHAFVTPRALPAA